MSRRLKFSCFRLLLGILFGLLLLGFKPAHAALQFGCVIPNQLASSQETAREFGLYLEHRLGESFRFRFFDNQDNLLPWVSRYREIDVAIVTDAFLRQHPGGYLRIARIIPREEAASSEDKSFLIVRPNLSGQLRQTLENILLQMSDDPEGQQVLAKTGAKGFVAAYDAPTATTSTKAAVIPAAPAQPIGKKAERALRFGCVIPNSFLPGAPYARRLAFYLQNRLQQPVAAQIFPDEETLYKALQRFGNVDIAFLSDRFLKARPLSRLPQLLHCRGKAASGEGDTLVAKKELSVSLRKAVQDILGGMANDAEGQRFLQDIGADPLQIPTNAVSLNLQPSDDIVASPAAALVEETPAATLYLQRITPAPEAAVPPATAVSAPVFLALPPTGLRKEQQGLWTEALLFYQDFLQQHPERLDLWQRLADIQTMLQHPEGATLSLLWGNRYTTTDQAANYFQLALAHAFNNQSQAAVAACRHAAQLDPDNLTYLRVLGLLARDNNDQLTQRESFQKLLRHAWQ